MNLQNLNKMFLDRLQGLWQQQDQDWSRTRNWTAQDRSRRMGREDAAFDHQKSMFGMQRQAGGQVLRSNEAAIGRVWGDQWGGRSFIDQGQTSMFPNNNQGPRSPVGTMSYGGNRYQVGATGAMKSIDEDFYNRYGGR